MIQKRLISPNRSVTDDRAARFLLLSIESLVGSMVKGTRSADRRSGGRAEGGRVVENGLPGQLSGADEGAVVEGARADRDGGAAIPGTARRHRVAELVRGGEQQVLVQSAEQHPVRV